MIGGMCRYATNSPLPMPKATPTSSPTPIAKPGGNPATISPAVKVPDNAITGPTDKSMPPVRITQVMPTAMIALIDTWRAMLERLLAVRKVSLARIITRVTTTSPTKG